MPDFIKTPCKHCPFRTDVKPFLHPERAADIAYAASNPYQSFSCHKTLDHDDEGETYAGEKALECAGFLTLRARNGSESDIPDGFVPAWDICYESPEHMIEAYERGG